LLLRQTTTSIINCAYQLYARRRFVAASSSCCANCNTAYAYVLYVCMYVYNVFVKRVFIIVAIGVMTMAYKFIVRSSVVWN